MEEMAQAINKVSKYAENPIATKIIFSHQDVATKVVIGRNLPRMVILIEVVTVLEKGDAMLQAANVIATNNLRSIANSQQQQMSSTAATATTLKIIITNLYVLTAKKTLKERLPERCPRDMSPMPNNSTTQTITGRAGRNMCMSKFRIQQQQQIRERHRQRVVYSSRIRQ